MAQERRILQDLQWDLMPAALEVSSAAMFAIAGARRARQPACLPATRCCAGACQAADPC